MQKILCVDEEVIDIWRDHNDPYFSIFRIPNRWIPPNGMATRYKKRRKFWHSFRHIWTHFSISRNACGLFIHAYEGQRRSG